MSVLTLLMVLGSLHISFTAEEGTTQLTQNPHNMLVGFSIIYVFNYLYLVTLHLS